MSRTSFLYAHSDCIVIVSSSPISMMCVWLNTNPYSVNQIEIHPFLSWDECVTFCERESVAIMAYSPLAKAGKLDNKTLVEIAKK